LHEPSTSASVLFAGITSPASKSGADSAVSTELRAAKFSWRTKKDRHVAVLNNRRGVDKVVAARHRHLRDAFAAVFVGRALLEGEEAGTGAAGALLRHVQGSVLQK